MGLTLIPRISKTLDFIGFSGSGTIVTSLDNGLTQTGSNGQLGGPLIQNTDISGAFNLSFTTQTISLGTTSPIADTYLSVLGQGNTDATWTAQFRKLNGDLTLGVRDDRVVFIATGSLISNDEVLAVGGNIATSGSIKTITSGGDSIKCQTLAFEDRLTLGYSAGNYGTIQSFGGLPVRLNGLGNNVELGAGKWIFGNFNSGQGNVFQAESLATTTTPPVGGVFYEVTSSSLFIKLDTDEFICVAGKQITDADDYTQIVGVTKMIYTGTGGHTFTLHTAAGYKNTEVVIKNSGSGNLTIDASGAETIDGALTQLLTPTNSMTICSTGTNWIIT